MASVTAPPWVPAANKSARLLQAPFSPPFQSLSYFNSIPKLSISPVPLPNCSSLLFDVWICWCSWVMSYCAKWWQLRWPFPLFSANPPLKQIMQSKKGSFQQSLLHRCRQIWLNAEAIGAATVTWAWQGRRVAGRRGEDALLKLKLSIRIGTERGLKWLWMWDSCWCETGWSAGIFTRNHR